jgi:KDO2-lipid IV(A) lauroyltransferase
LVANASTRIVHGDLRLGGAWTARQRLKNDAVWLVVRAALGAARLVPPAPVRNAAGALGALAYVFAWRARRTALANAALVYPHWSPGRRAALVRRSFTALGGWLGESVRALAGAPGPAPLDIGVGSLGVLRAAQSRGRGVLFASAHLGPWERVAASLVAAGVPLVTMARESYDPRFSHLFEGMRSRAGVRVICRGDPTAPWKMVRALRRGDVLGMPMDLRTRVDSRPVPFLGHPAPTPIGPARIALRTGAPVVVGTAEPAGDGRTSVTVTRILTGDLRDDEDGAFELTGRINAELSRRILAFPEAWVWMHDRWTGPAEV